MHPNAAFAWGDEDAMLALVSDIAFTRLFAMTVAGPRVAHVPVIVRGRALRFHLANGNALTSAIAGATVLALTEGAHHYISANWYGDARGSVPTWNYVAVECEGTVTRLDRDALIDQIDELTADREATVGENWHRAKMEPRRFEAMLGAITGFELAITALRGTRKLSQNKNDADVGGLAAGLARVGSTDMAKMMIGERA